jgi:hypothetical protein
LTLLSVEINKNREFEDKEETNFQALNANREIPGTQRSPYHMQNVEHAVWLLKVTLWGVFAVVWKQEFNRHEHVLSVVSARLGDDINTYYTVSTAVVRPAVPKKGAIVVYQYKDGKLSWTTWVPLNGHCAALMEFRGKLLAVIEERELLTVAGRTEMTDTSTVRQ